MLEKALAVVVVVALLLAVPTAAVTGPTDDGAQGITMAPHSGPNGQYASIDSSGEIEVAFQDLNRHAVTQADDVFNVTNDANTTMAVWVEVDGVTAYRGTRPGTPVDSAADAVELAPGETLEVGFEVPTGDSAPSTSEMTVHAENVTASSGGSTGGSAANGSTSTDDGRAVLDASLSVENGSSPVERVITVTVENTGSAAGSYTAEPTVNGTPVGAQTVTVLPGESRTLRFTYRFDGPGTYAVALGGEVVRLTVASEVGAEFRVTDLSVADDRVSVGEATEVVATVANEGTAPGTYTAVLLANGTVVAERPVTVPAGETREVRFGVTFEEPGVRELRVGDRRANVTVDAGGPLRVVDASVADDRVEPGNATTIAATVENTGDRPGTTTLAVSVGGVVVEEVTVTVPAGETRTVTVSHRFDTPGIYPVAVGGVSAGEVTVGEGATTADRILRGSLGVAVGLPLVVGLLLALWRRRLFAAFR